LPPKAMSHAIIKVGYASNQSAGLNL